MTKNTKGIPPLPAENEKQLKDLHGDWNEHRLDDREIEDRAIPYDEDFYNYRSKRSNSYSAGQKRTNTAEAAYFDTGKERIGTDEVAVQKDVQRLQTDVREDSSSALDEKYLLPIEFGQGQHFGGAVVCGMPLVLGLVSNADSIEASTERKARIGVSALKYDEEQIDVKMMDFRVDSKEEKKQLPYLLKEIRKEGGLTKTELGSVQAGLLSLTLLLDPHILLLTETPGCRSTCYHWSDGELTVLNAGHPTKTIDHEPVPLVTGDVVFAVSEDLIRHLVRRRTQRMTKNSELPEELIVAESADIVADLLKNSLEKKTEIDGERTIETLELSQEKLCDNLSKLMDDADSYLKENDITVKSFFAYQMP